MKKKYKILITGACGVTSRSVVRSLLMSEKFKNAEFIGTDICENLFGLYEGLYKTIYKVPNVKSNEYKQLMEQIIIKESIDVAIIIPELEVLFWSINKFCIPYIVPPPKFAESVISKKNLYDMLKETCLIPDYRIFSKEEILSKSFINPITYPCWIRDFEEGSTSGKGSFMASNKEQMEAWMVINEGIDNFMVSEFLPGRNYACHLLYFHGKLLKVAIYERLEYFMKKVVISGISGNISKGKLINNKLVKENAIKAINIINNINHETMHGIVAVDMKDDYNEIPKITEINIRHVAATSAFASAGFNLAEYHLLCALNRIDEMDGLIEMNYPEKNLILRDIDGLPIWIPEFHPLNFGDKII